jgi:hypothetical protein
VTASLSQCHTRVMNKVFAKKKLLLFSCLIPFVLATVAYHYVFVCDASVRSQWIDTSKVDINDKAAIDKAVEQEENRRWNNGPAWGVHALVIGLPVGLFSLLIISGSALVWSMLTRRGKAGDSL